MLEGVGGRWCNWCTRGVDGRWCWGGGVYTQCKWRNWCTHAVLLVDGAGGDGYKPRVNVVNGVRK